MKKPKLTPEQEAVRSSRIIDAAFRSYFDLKRNLEYAKNVKAYLEVTGDTKDVIYVATEMTIHHLKTAVDKIEKDL